MIGMKFGGYVEYICLSEKGMIVVKSENVIYEEVVFIFFGGMMVLYFFRKGNI